MLAGRTHFRSFFSDIDVTAVQADPLLRSNTGKDFAFLDVFKKFAVTLLVMFFDCGNALELTGNIVETFFFCLFCEICIH